MRRNGQKECFFIGLDLGSYFNFIFTLSSKRKNDPERGLMFIEKIGDVLFDPVGVELVISHVDFYKHGIPSGLKKMKYNINVSLFFYQYLKNISVAP